MLIVSPPLPPARVKAVHAGLVREGDAIRSAAKGRGLSSLQASMRTLANRVHQLTGHCNVSLVHEAVRDLAGALEPEFGIPEISVVSGSCGRPPPAVV